MKKIGIVSAAVGIAGATAVGLVADRQRRAVGRARSAVDEFAGEELGNRHTEPLTVVASDGVGLRAEVDGDLDSPLTIVFVHGFTLSMACWHFQRRDLRDLGRLVFYDQRSHGASGRSSIEHSTIEQLGDDLERILDQLVPEGQVVLIGHSMGGMTILALAARRPELFGTRIVGTALLSTSAGKLAQGLFGLPGFAARGLHPFLPRLARGAHSRAQLIERGRLTGSVASYVMTRWLSYGPEAPAALVDFMERMIAATPVEVMAEFFDTFLSHDKLAALDVLRSVPTVIVCGELDVLTPPDHSRTMAAALPDAELVLIPGAGHMAIVDRYAVVDAAIRRLVRRATVSARVDPPVPDHPAAAAQ